MSNPWHFKPAFDFFFSDKIEISCTRNNQISSISADVCLFPPEDEDTITDSEIKSDIKIQSFLLRKSDWTQPYKLQYGDVVHIPAESKNMYIQKVDAEQDWYSIKTRSKK